MTNLMNGKYFEIELDPEIMLEVEALAGELNVTPFDMAVILLQETLSFYVRRAPPE